MDALKRKRARVKGDITRVNTYLNNFDIESQTDVNELIIRETLLVKSFNEFCKFQEQIEDLIETDAGAEAQLAEREEVENKYIVCHGKIRTYIQTRLNPQTENLSANGTINQRDISNGNIQQSRSTAPAVRYNLPSMKIPIFTGNYGEWRTFIDLFTASIHNDSGLADSQKFVYLKSFLKSEPLSLINEFNISDSNYKKALDILKARYDKKMPIVNHHINGIMQATVIKGINGLRDFLSQIKQHINALESLNINVMGHWDLLLISIFSSKIDRNLRNEFELSRDQTELPNLTEFFEFLEKRAIAWESSSQNLNLRNE